MSVIPVRIASPMELELELELELEPSGRGEYKESIF